MSTTDFGPVSTTHYNPTYSQAATADGISDVQIGGSMPRAGAEALFELVNNRAVRITVRGRTGVLEYITSSYPVIAAFNGYYLLHSFTFDPYKFDTTTLAVDFTLHASFLGGLA
jgi:hypothetical protein